MSYDEEMFKKWREARLKFIADNPAAWRKRDETERLSRPPPEPDIGAGSVVETWVLHGPGWSHIIRLKVPPDRGTRRPRSDQFDVEVDDVIVRERVGASEAAAVALSLRVRIATRAQRHGC